MEAAKYLCPQKVNLFANISLSANSVVQRTEELGENIVIQLCQRVFCGILWPLMNLPILQVHHKCQCSFVVLIWISKSLKRWYQFTACTEKQLEKIVFLKYRKPCRVTTSSGINFNVEPLMMEKTWLD